MEKQQSICMDEYQYQSNLLYKGHHSSIFKAINKYKKHQPYIFKSYPQSYLNDPIKQKKLMHELNTLWKFNGKENIVQIVSQHSRDQKVFIIMEFCELGTLAEQIKKEGKFSQQKAMAYIQQIIRGYRHIYQCQIVHRNIQPSNILCAGLQLKIGDFSDSINLSDIRLSAMHQELVGDIHFQPFETLSEYRYSIQSDIYALGAVLFFMVKGRPPFEGLSKTEIIAKMKKTPVKDVVKDIRSKKIKEFLEKTLQMDQQKRMGIEELINFKFDSMPQLHKFKLYTFDDRSDQIIEQPIGSHRDKNTSFESLKPQKQKFQNSTKLLFKRFQPSPSSKKASLVDLKISDQCELSRLYRDKQISIFIPTKFDLNTSLPLEHQESQIISHFNIDCIQPIEKRTSQGFIVKKKETLGNQFKGRVNGDQVNKNRTIRDLVDNMNQPKNQSKLTIAKNQSKNLKSTNAMGNHHAIDYDHAFVPPLQFKQQNMTRQCNQGIDKQRKAVLQSKRTATERSKGLFTLRGREEFRQENGQSRNTLIGGWLVSQIDMFRFINRVSFRIKKVEASQLKPLNLSLEKLKKFLLDSVKNLTYLSPQQKNEFEQSSQCDKIRQIVAAYESRCAIGIGLANFEGFQKMSKITIEGINWLYKELLASTLLKQDLIKLLDYLITLWQLIKLLKKNNLEYFHSRSKIQEILDSKQSKLTVAHLLQLYQRMKTLRLI